MAGVLDRIMQRVEIDPKTAENTKQVYSNMMVYLKEMKLHNVKNLDLAEQIVTLSESSVQKLNEMKAVLADKLSDKKESDEFIELLKQTELLQQQVNGMAELLREMNANNVKEDEEEKEDKLLELLKELDNVKNRLEERIENQERIMKREISSGKEMIETSIDEQKKEILEEIYRVKRTIKRYVRSCLWVGGMILVLMILQVIQII